MLTSATTTRRSQSAGASSGSAIESEPSGCSPRCHSTKPPKIERAAEPEPRRASAESAGGSSRRPAARLPARASAANAAADDASPAPRGTRLRVTTRARSVRAASCRRTSRKSTSRSRSAPLAGSPSMVRSSIGASPKPTSASTDSPSRVSEMLPVAGRLSEASRFPQYFTRATLTLERAVTGVANIGRATSLYPVRGRDARTIRSASCRPARRAPIQARGAQGREETRLPLIEPLRVQGVAQVQIGVVQVVAELVQQRPEKGPVGDYLAPLGGAHPERDPIPPAPVGGQVEAVQLAASVVRPLALHADPEPRHTERAADVVGDLLCHCLDRSDLLAEQDVLERRHRLAEPRTGPQRQRGDAITRRGDPLQRRREAAIPRGARARWWRSGHACAEPSKPRRTPRRSRTVPETPARRSVGLTGRPLGEQSEGEDDEGDEHRGCRVATQCKPAGFDRLVQEVADHGTEWSREDERRPEQRRPRDPGAAV